MGLTLDQDYLSKPLQASQLIQTILRYATHSGTLYDHEQRHTMDYMTAPEISLGSDSPASTLKGSMRRPQLEARGYTERGGADSPSLLAADQPDTVDRVSLGRV